jgi:hypothetical protein
LNGVPDWKWRSFFFSCLIVEPFLKFLARNQTGVFHAEIALAVLWLLAVSLALAFISRKAPVFYVLMGVCVVLIASYPFQSLLQPLVRIPLGFSIAAVAGAVSLAMWLMRLRFFPVMAVFLCSGLAIEIVSHFAGRTAPGSVVEGPGGHVLWLVLDEQIGIAGFPRTPECDAARTTLQNTLDRYNFTSFPNAFSNYSDTIDSVPSVINSRLLHYPQELVAKAGAGNLRHYQVVRNQMFSDFAGRGYHLVGYQHGSLRECDAAFSSAECRQYEDRLGWLYRAPGGWRERFRWLVGTYQAGDPLLGRVKGFFPFRFGLKITGPLALTDLWPDQLAAGILAEPRRTLIFAHLLTPHSPYLFRRDGSIRPLEEWSGDRADQRVDAEEYASRYRRYCGQVEFTAIQLGSLLQKLNSRGMLSGMTVVVHGDHGSRIREKLGRPGDNQVMPDVFDYTGEPTLRDLQDRFSTLLAIKLPGAKTPAQNVEKHGLLTFLSRVLYHREPSDGVDASDRVYLVDHKDQFQSIDLLKYWR